MKKNQLLLAFAVMVVTLPLLAFTWVYVSDVAEKDAVKAVVESAYLNGIHNKQNTQDALKGFHPDFVMFTYKKGEMGKLGIKDWVEKIEKKKVLPEYNAKEFERPYKFKEVDVVGNVAVVKVELFKENNLTFTDYLSLYKFEDGWKIVTKVYNYHEQPAK